MRRAVVSIFISASLWAGTQITDTITDASNNPAEGVVTFTPVGPWANGSGLTSGRPVSQHLVGGALSVNLPGGQHYTITWTPSSLSPVLYAYVPVTSNTLKLSDITALANTAAQIAPAEILPSGATVGQAMCFLSSGAWGPGSCGGGGGGGTWGSITGTLSAQTDLAAALSGKQAAISGAPGSWPSFAPVATSGSYADLSGKPTIPSYPAAGLAKSTGAGWTPPAFSDVVGLFASGSCSGYLKSDGTCSASSGTRYITATFLLCAGPCVATETSNWKWSAPFALTVTGCTIDAQTYPTGAAITVDVLKAGTTTIFASTVPTLAAGSSAYNTQTGMAAAAAFNAGDFAVAKVLTVGSSVAGQFVNVVCTASY